MGAGWRDRRGRESGGERGGRTDDVVARRREVLEGVLHGAARKDDERRAAVRHGRDARPHALGD